jgi:hypothetical protein
MSLTHLIKRRRRFLVLAAPPGGQAGSKEGGYPALSLHFLSRFHLTKHNQNSGHAVKTITTILRKSRGEIKTSLKAGNNENIFGRCQGYKGRLTVTVMMNKLAKKGGGVT